MRFLAFADDKEDAEKAAKLREAALRIEQAIERQKSISELVDYKPPPEEEIDLANDTRSLYERLLEQKNKKQEALEESQKLSNLVTKLDEDEAEYLNELAKSKQEEEIRKRLEVYDALEEQKRNSERKIIEEEKKLKESYLGSKNQPIVKSLKSKLSSIIKVRPKSQSSSQSSTMVSEEQKPTVEMVQDNEGSRQTNKRQSNEPGLDTKVDDSMNGAPLESIHSNSKRLKTDDAKSRNECRRGITPLDPHCNCIDQKDLMRCIGVLPSLPLLDRYPDSSDSDNSDDNPESRIVPRIGGRNK